MSENFVVPCEAHSDDHRVSVTFDAGPYLPKLSAAEIQELTSCGFSGCYAADAVYEWARDSGDPRVQELSDYLDFVSKHEIRMPYSDDPIGFEVEVDEDAARKLLGLADE